MGGGKIFLGLRILQFLVILLFVGCRGELSFYEYGVTELVFVPEYYVIESNRGLYYENDGRNGYLMLTFKEEPRKYLYRNGRIYTRDELR